MSALAKSAALKINWVGIISSLGLKGQTAASLQAFKKRNEDARRKVAVLREQTMEVNFPYYRSILRNQAIIDEVENAWKRFRPVTYDVEKQIKIIEGFEAEAVRNAEATKGRVDNELKELEKTLRNIEEARSFEDLTVDDIAAARPDIDARTAEMVEKGRWMPAGYKVFPIPKVLILITRVLIFAIGKIWRSFRCVKVVRVRSWLVIWDCVGCWIV